MATTTLSTNLTHNQDRTSLLARFNSFCAGQESNRLMWLGGILAAHGCIITPLTVMAVLLAGAPIFLFILALVAMGMALVTNLAALPTRITIPVFAISILIDIAVVIGSIAVGLDIAKTYI